MNLQTASNDATFSKIGTELSYNTSNAQFTYVIDSLYKHATDIITIIVTT